MTTHLIPIGNRICFNDWLYLGGDAALLTSSVIGRRLRRLTGHQALMRWRLHATQRITWFSSFMRQSPPRNSEYQICSSNSIHAHHQPVEQSKYIVWMAGYQSVTVRKLAA